MDRLDGLRDPETALRRATEALRRGGVVAVPTDTLYGLAADPFAPGTLERISQIKGAREGKPLLLLLHRAGDVRRLCASVPETFERAAGSLWPGPVTLLLPAAPDLPPDLVGPEGTVAVRVPDAALAGLLAGEIGPITGTSANPTGMPPPASADEVVALFPPGVPAPDLLLDGGRCPGGPPSTILDLTGAIPRVVRAGAVGREEIERALGMRVEG